MNKKDLEAHLKDQIKTAEANCQSLSMGIEEFLQYLRDGTTPHGAEAYTRQIKQYEMHLREASAVLRTYQSVLAFIQQQ